MEKLKIKAIVKDLYDEIGKIAQDNAGCYANNVRVAEAIANRHPSLADRQLITKALVWSYLWGDNYGPHDLENASDSRYENLFYEGIYDIYDLGQQYGWDWSQIESYIDENAYEEDK